MSNNYTHIIDLAKEVLPPDDGILTRTLFNDDHVKAVIFGFGPQACKAAKETPGARLADSASAAETKWWFSGRSE